jgi:hypothetical protein
LGGIDGRGEVATPQPYAFCICINQFYEESIALIIIYKKDIFFCQLFVTGLRGSGAKAVGAGQQQEHKSRRGQETETGGPLKNPQLDMSQGAVW